MSVIDFSALSVSRPELVRDLPAGGKRLIQRAHGYRHTFLSGVEVLRDDRLDRRPAGRGRPRRPGGPALSLTDHRHSTCHTFHHSFATHRLEERHTERSTYERKERSVAVNRWWFVCFRLLVVVLALVSAPLPAGAQSVAGKVPRVGVLGVTSAAGYARQVEAMRQGFRDLGYVEGQNIVFEFRWAEGRYDRLPALAAELIRLQPDVIVTSGPGTRVLKEATTTIPIVMAASLDAVAMGLVASLARPGGNITGSTAFGPELSAKRLEMLKGLCLVSPESRSC